MLSVKNKLVLVAFTLLCAVILLSSCSSRRRDAEYEHIEEQYQHIYILEEQPEEDEPEEEPEVPRLVYVALGDSVSEGFGIWSPSDRHTSVFFEKLYAQGFANEYVNMAISGFTTTDLLELLHGLGPEELETMQYASVITLNIGGNNILAPFMNHMPDSDDVQRIVEETMAFAAEAWELAQQIMEFAGEAQEVIAEVLDFADEVLYFVDNFRVLDVFRINDMVAAASPVLDSATETFAEVNALETAVTDMFGRTNDLDVVDLFALFTGTFPAALEAEFQAGIRQFSYEFIQIITWLADNASDAVVIVNTVYNPLPTHFFGLHIGFADESKRLAQAINQIIYEESQTHGFIVSDVYASLSQRLDMMNLSFDIIHPNSEGHQIIAELNFSDFVNGQP